MARTLEITPADLHALRDPGASIPNRRWIAAYALLAGIHLLMLGYDVGHPDRFMHADRTRGRMDAIEGFAQATDPGSYLAAHGIVGDWLPQALLWLWGGQYAVIAVQVMLALLSVVWVRSIGTRLGLDARAAGTAAILYGLLPHTLVLPHQLASEAIFIPLLVASFALVARASHTGRGLVLAGALLGAATLVRPITLLWPLVCLPCLGGSPRARAGFVAAAAAPLALWMAFIFAATGEISMGRSDHDLGRNLYERAERIAAAAGVAAPESPTGDRRLGVSAYLGFVADQPAASLLHSARDVMVLGVKSGFERLVIDYLDLAPAERAELQAGDGWRSRLERDGAWSVLKETLRRDPALVLAAAGGAAVFVGLMALALAGALAWLREKADAPAARLHALRVMLVLFPVYVFLTAQVVDAAQSRHRAPAELALCLLAVAGLREVRRVR